MRTSIFSILMLLLLFDFPKTNEITPAFESTLVSSQETYKLGENPLLTVAIKNNSGKSVQLISALDGSEVQRRMPYTYLTIINPDWDTLDNRTSRCKFMNPLRMEDFKQVNDGEEFNPYRYGENIHIYSQQIENSFTQIGTYQITFHYSTLSDNTHDFLGLGETSQAIEDALKQVPRMVLSSNTVEIEITQK